jgi:Fe-S cluster assembly protein SufD
VTVAAQLAGGELCMTWLDDQARDAGVIVADLHQTDGEGLLGSVVGAEHGFVEAINAAAWQGGVLVRVPPGVRLEHPIRVRVEADAGGATVLPRVLIVAGESRAFDVVEGHAGGNGVPSQVLGVTEIVVGRGAEVNYGLVQRWQPSVAGHLTVRARLDAGARFQMALASFGGGLYKADVGALLAGERAQSETFGVAMGGDRQHFDHHTEHVHLAARTHSNLDFKVALTHAARSTYTGMIRIAPEAGGSEAYQENRNLLSGSAVAIPSSKSSPTTCAAAMVRPWRRRRGTAFTSEPRLPLAGDLTIVYGFDQRCSMRAAARASASVACGD